MTRTTAGIEVLEVVDPCLAEVEPVGVPGVVDHRAIKAPTGSVHGDGEMRNQHVGEHENRYRAVAHLRQAAELLLDAAALRLVEFVVEQTAKVGGRGPPKKKPLQLRQSTGKSVPVALVVDVGPAVQARGFPPVAVVVELVPQSAQVLLDHVVFDRVEHGPRVRAVAAVCLGETVQIPAIEGGSETLEGHWIVREGVFHDRESTGSQRLVEGRVVDAVFPVEGFGTRVAVRHDVDDVRQFSGAAGSSRGISGRPLEVLVDGWRGGVTERRRDH